MLFEAQRSFVACSESFSLLSPTPWSLALLWGRQPSAGLGNQEGQLCILHTHSVLRVNFAIGAAISSPLKEIGGLPLHMLVCFLTRLRTKRGDVCKVLPSYSSSSPFSAPQPWAFIPPRIGSLGKLKVTPLPMPLIALQWYPIHNRYSAYICWLDKWPRHKNAEVTVLDSLVTYAQEVKNIPK